MNSDLFQFSDRSKCFDLRNFVPPTALTRFQTLDLQQLTSADNEKYSQAMATVPTVIYTHPVFVWALETRREWTLQWFLKVKEYHIKHKLDFFFSVCLLHDVLIELNDCMNCLFVVLFDSLKRKLQHLNH